MVPQIYNGIIFSYVYNGIKGLTTVKKNNGLEYCQAYSVQKVPSLKVTVSTGNLNITASTQYIRNIKVTRTTVVQVL